MLPQAPEASKTTVKSFSRENQMKGKMKAIAVASVLFTFTSLLMLQASPQEGIPIYTFGNVSVVGYANNGAGFAFSPNVPIAVTALGFGGSDLTSNPYQVTLYNSSGTQLATAHVTTGSPFSNQTYYQGISAVNLTAGATYYLQATEAGNTNSVWVGNVVGVDASGTFSVNSDISYLNSAVNFISGIPTVLNSPGDFFVDENFQFTVVPEPGVLGFLALGGFFFGRRWQSRIRG
jgi:hypothetical protein